MRITPYAPDYYTSERGQRARERSCELRVRRDGSGRILRMTLLLAHGGSVDVVTFDIEDGHVETTFSKQLGYHRTHTTCTYYSYLLRVRRYYIGGTTRTYFGVVYVGHCLIM